MQIESFTYFPLIIFLFFLFNYLPGRFILKILKAPTYGLLGLALSSGVGMVIMPYIYNLSFAYFGFTTISYWAVSLCTLLSLWSISKQIKSESKKDSFENRFKIFTDKKTLIVSLFLVVALMFLSFMSYQLIKDTQGRWHTTVIGDSDKHLAIVTSLVASKKFPPHSSLIRLSEDVPLRYYHFYYLLSAAPIVGLSFAPNSLLTFGVISSISIGVILILLAGIAKYLFKTKSSPFFAILIGYMAGFQFPYLYDQFKKANLIRWPGMFDNHLGLLLKVFPNGVDFTPQHLFASGIFIIMVALIAFSKNKKALLIVLALIHAASFMFSIFVFAGITFGMIFFAFFILYKERLNALKIIPLYLVFFLIFFVRDYKIMAAAADPTPFSSIYTLGPVHFLKSPIFGQIRQLKPLFGSTTLPLFFWYIAFYLQRIGPFLILGTLGILYYRKKILKNSVFFILFAILVTTFISIGFLQFGGGGQNEYSKNASLFITFSLGIYMAGFAGVVFEKMKKNFFSYILKLLIVVILSIGLASGIWEYYWALVDVKMNMSREQTFEEAPGALYFLKSVERDAVVFVSKSFEWHVNNFSFKKVNFTRLSAWSVGYQRIIDEYGKNATFQDIFNTGPFDEKAWKTLKKWNTSYIVIIKFDPIFEKRKELVDSKFFKEVFSEKGDAVYKLIN